ncbi:DUF1692-domain-containing protein [Cystobasidium minutum MCA 4210]|uniref:DUF1692-domain-containing protein n=1 Tax=Cystobasidium minutum MCA 4210 TaxID=1397322 RepID=UPI0034CD398C|eukprot:jgi/Rhomi1/164005/estExt_Genewise1Plus.C_90283
MNGSIGNGHSAGLDAADATAQHPLMKIPPIREFDAFPKTLSTYKSRSSRGGVLTLLLSAAILFLVWHELREYLFGDPEYSFAVDKGVAHQLQINVDMTIAMPCHFLTVDVRDAVGDRLHISEEFKKEGTTFEIGQAQRIRNLEDLGDQSASSMLRASKARKKFDSTKRIVKDGPACRIYGMMEVKRVTGNLHVTTLGHGYMSWEHTDHSLMNLSHVIHEFSFGPFFPRIVQPLDNSVELASGPFHIFQYFISVVSTRYIDASRHQLDTNQYSVTDMSRETQHGKGVPGIFFKYDIEPMSLTIRERTTSLVDFLVRLAGIVGGILVCSNYAWRVGHAVVRGTKRKLTGPENKGGVSRGEKEGLIPFQSPEKGLTPAGYRTSYL